MFSGVSWTAASKVFCSYQRKLYQAAQRPAASFFSALCSTYYLLAFPPLPAIISYTDLRQSKSCRIDAFYCKKLIGFNVSKLHVGYESCRSGRLRINLDQLEFFNSTWMPFAYPLCRNGPATDRIKPESCGSVSAITIEPPQHLLSFYLDVYTCTSYLQLLFLIVTLLTSRIAAIHLLSITLTLKWPFDNPSVVCKKRDCIFCVPSSFHLHTVLKKYTVDAGTAVPWSICLKSEYHDFLTGALFSAGLHFEATFLRALVICRQSTFL